MPGTDPIAGLDGLYFAAKRLVDGLYTGRHTSPLRGSGIEFHDYRPYSPGDDLRSIDWKRYGRTNRYYLKRYRRETDLNLFVAVDGSASMSFATLEGDKNKAPTKFAIAQQLAAALTTLAIRQGDRAGLTIFDKQLRCMHPATGSPRRLQAMIADLEQAQPASGPADLSACLIQLAQQLGSRKAAIAVISDLLDTPDPLLSAIDRLRFAGHEVLVFQVLSPDELALPDAAKGLRMIDPELGPSVQTSPRQVARQYQLLMKQHLDHLRQAFNARGVDDVLVNTGEPLIGVLRQYLMRRAARAR